MAIKPITFQGVNNFKANLYALEIRSRFSDQANANGYYEKYGDELAASAESNVIKIASGALLVQGRLFEITADGESVNVIIESGKVGYVIARIETYRTDRQNCSIVVKTATTLNEIPLIQEDTYTVSSDTNENKIYELPLYSFTMPSANVITSFQKLITPINEIAKIANIASNANEKSNSALANSGGGYTFIIDSNLKLQQWAENADGNDYSRVLIKKGTWEYTKGVDLKNSGTIQVIGEGGNLIKITPSNNLDHTLCCAFTFLGDITPKGFCIIGVNVEVVDIEDKKAISGFANCNNLFNCSANVKGRFSCGFEECTNLINCSSIAMSGYANCYGFYKCSKLLYCLGSGNSSRNSGYGFCDCNGVSYCSKNGTSDRATFDTSNCCANLGDYNSTYAVANTANGGFNDIT